MESTETAYRVLQLGKLAANHRVRGGTMQKEPHHQRPALRPIPLRNLLSELDPHTCKLHCAVFDGVVEPINVLATDWDEWVGWSRWRGARDHFNRQFIFTMARVPKTLSH